MNRYSFLAFLALCAFLIALPVYASQETARLKYAQSRLQAAYVEEGVDLYLAFCLECHGMNGEGGWAMPALDNPAFADASPSTLFQVIARAAHGTGMAAWHKDEGGILNEYDIGALVALIQHGDWVVVGDLAKEKKIQPPQFPDPEYALLLQVPPDAEDPHDCIACHEEPEIHAERFGLNCANCHTLQAWKPALLTRHKFLLEHGDEGQQSCQVCHPDTYVAYTCYECHDHEPAQMLTVHVEVGLETYENCAECHPTGVPGEAETLQKGW